MIAVDTNLLVYAHREDSEFHHAADRVLRELAEGRASWAIPWPCLYEFYAIVTHPKIYQPPTPVPGALNQIEAWLESPSLVLLHEGEGFFDNVNQILAASKVKGGAVHDAKIAALCLRYGVKMLLSADRDFSRFPMLKTTNPLRG